MNGNNNDYIYEASKYVVFYCVGVLLAILLGLQMMVSLIDQPRKTQERVAAERERIGVFIGGLNEEEAKEFRSFSSLTRAAMKTGSYLDIIVPATVIGNRIRDGESLDQIASDPRIQEALRSPDTPEPDTVWDVAFVLSQEFERIKTLGDKYKPGPTASQHITKHTHYFE